MFSICVIGCGYMAREGHGPAYAKYAKEYPGVRLAGCCDLDPQKAEAFRKEFGFEKAFTDYRAMLEEMMPSVVCLLSPVSATCELAVDILKKGFSLLLEKPPGRNREEIGRINAAALEAGVSVRTAFNRRYTPLLLELKKRIAGERIYNITYQMYRFNRRDADFSTTSIHAIDAVKNLAGSDYRNVSLSYQELPEHGENVANIYLNGEMENGVFAQLSLVPMGNAVVERVTVNTDQATYFAELPFWGNPDAPGRLRKIAANQTVEDISGAALVDCCEMYEESGFYEENRSFFEHLRAGEKTQNDLPSGIQGVEIADCIRKRITVYKK